MQHRNIIILCISQALAMSGPPLVILIGGIVGAQLAPRPALATLPITTMVVGVALFTVPASLLMRRIGRRAGFILAALVAAGAALLAAYAVSAGSFALLCVATLLIGGNNSFAQQYRFAAAESVVPERAARAVSLMLLAGVAAGVLGPELAKRTTGLLPGNAYAAPFLSIALLYVAVAAVLSLFQETSSEEEVEQHAARPLRAIVLEPVYIAAVTAGMLGYGVMSLLMTATPVSMHVVDGHSLEATSLVIQSHVVAMYLPSFFTGHLITRLGITRVMQAGVLALGASVALALSSQQVSFYWGALVLLGIGWNFLYVSGTVLLAESYRAGERFKAQALNDFLVFGIQACASLAAGSLLLLTGWQAVNLLTVPFLVAMFIALLALNRRRAREAESLPRSLFS